jgi:NAD(P)-dependent dehydrogenase (short-subunit alcohol dehydrogenase family)
MAWTETDIPPLKGKVAVVTGGNAGLGLETVRVLAGAGASVVMASRNPEKAEAARNGILGSLPSAVIEAVELDLASLDSTRQAASRIADRFPRLDLLVNNAGVMALPESQTEDGFEMQFGINHLGHWALTSLLLPSLLAAPAARIVTVTSTAHHFGRGVDPDNPHLRGRYRPWRAYFESKLANFHFGIGLEEKLRASGASAASLIAHPGLSNTELQRKSVEENGDFTARFFHRLAGSTGMDPAAGALPQLRAATDPEAKGGQFYAPRFGNFGPPVRRPILRRIGLDRSIDRLWEASAAETGIALDPAQTA